MVGIFTLPFFETAPRSSSELLATSLGVAEHRGLKRTCGLPDTCRTGVSEVRESRGPSSLFVGGLCSVTVATLTEQPRPGGRVERDTAITR